MSAQIGNHNFTNIGRMFARQNVPAVYGQQKAAVTADDEAVSGAVDQVSLSPFAPRPYAAKFFEDAVRVGRSIGNDGRLSPGTSERLREDRVFAAVSALAIVGEDGTGGRSWPGGIPTPTPEELEAARRRLAQRLDNPAEAEDPAAAQRDRLSLLERLGRRDISVLAPTAAT